MYIEKTSISALAITDTNAHAGSAVQLEPGGTLYAVLCTNLLNQNCSFQLQGAMDQDGPWFNVGSAISVTSNADYGYATFTEPWPWVRVVATAGSTPSSGTVTAKIVRFR